MEMEIRKLKHGFFRFLRLYPVFALAALGVVYLLGGFDTQHAPTISRTYLDAILYSFAVFAPLIIIVIFIIISTAEDRARARNVKNLANFDGGDPFDLSYEKMHGYKVAALTGGTPTFTGVTGDTYQRDDSAKCTISPDHVPPVSSCECGFYAFKNLRDAKFELSIHPGLFLIDVDLFGIGFAHKYGYRAESQRVNTLIAPRRCMRCKTFPARTFIKSYKMGYGDNAWWQWSMRCVLCSRTIKSEDKLTINQMSQQLQVDITQNKKASGD